MKRILVIDDNPRNNSIYTAPLKREYKVDVVMSLTSAIRMLQHYRYDLLVIDVMMPTQNTKSPTELMTGLHFYEESVKESYPNLIVLFWSNRSKDDTFDPFFGDKVPNRVSFLHKDRNNREQLLETAINLIGR